jgi:KUP system potassium uptake protein
MVGCVGLVFSFGSSTNLAAAYGVAVTSTMVITTILLYHVMRERWGWTQAPAVALSGAFGVVDMAFFAANIVKVPAGGWFPLLVGALVFTTMTTWEHGRALLGARLHRGELPIERLIGSIAEHPQPRVPGTAVYMFPESGATPPALLANLRYNRVLHETVALVAVRTAAVPRIPQARRETVHLLGEGFVQIELTFGFMEEPNVPVALGSIVSSEFGFTLHDAVFFLARESVIPSEVPGMAMWREHLFGFMHRNASSAVGFFGLPSDRVVEIGRQVEI